MSSEKGLLRVGCYSTENDVGDVSGSNMGEQH